MALHEDKIEQFGSGTVTKEIDEGAYGLLTDLVQKYQYQYPEKSTIRELASNALDAIVEKQNSIAIINGSAKVEDFYIERGGSLYKDSNWNPEYYDLNWLSDNNQVEILYEIKEDSRDLLTITDYGVGLWGNRLKGYFKLGYSTKRNNKNTLGKYGIGAKSALSTGASSFVVENRYNGKLMIFQIFDHAYQSITPQINLETGKENEYFVVTNADGKEYRIYYTDTKEKNGLTIKLECKKIHRDKYIAAVKDQLMYFSNVVLKVKHINGALEHVPHAADILYEDENILLSDNNRYAKPHILIKRVNYGYVDFDELELEQRYGNIGIKVDSDEVTINPSRESLIWDDNTRGTVLKKYKEVENAATDLLTKELSSPNLVDWVVNYTTVGRHNLNDDTILGRLASIANLSSVEAYFKMPINGKVYKLYRKDIATIFPARAVKYETVTRAGSIVNKITRYVYGMNKIDSSTKYFLKKSPGALSNKKDKYLHSLHGEFVVIENWELTNNYAWFLESLHHASPLPKEQATVIAEKFLTDLKDSKYAYIFDDYDAIEVPEGWSEDEEEVIEEAVEEVSEDVQALRKRNGKEANIGKVAVKVFMDDDYNTAMKFKKDILPLTTALMNLDIDALKNCQVEELFYSNYNDSDNDLVAKAAFIVGLKSLPAKLDNSNSSLSNNFKDKYWWSNDGHIGFKSRGIKELKAILPLEERKGFYASNSAALINERIAIIKTSQASVKHFSKYKHIVSFFGELRNNTIKMSNALIRWNTARMIQSKLHYCRFLKNFTFFSPEMQSRYVEMLAYVDAYYVPLDRVDKQGFKAWSEGDLQNLIDHCERIYNFQKLAESDASPEILAQTAKELFGNPNIQNAHGADSKIIVEMEELVAYCEPYQLLNALPQLTGDTVTIDSWPHSLGNISTVKLTPELEEAITAYINFKSQNKNHDD